MARKTLRIGNTIWLNPSKKLLGMRKWFNTPFEDMPKRVFAEFKKHSHTHANVTVTSSSVNHTHAIFTYFTNCGNPEDWSHRHSQSMNYLDAHTHTLTFSFGAANLGSPNWWQHVHPITLLACSLNGTSHAHLVSVNTTLGGCMYLNCFYPAVNRHYHATSNGNTGSAGGAHTHTLPAINTNNAYSAQTPENHQHPYSVTLDTGDTHSHSYSGTISNATCYYGYDHGHIAGTATDAFGHNHTASGDSGFGGEPLPVAVVLTSDGLVWIK